MGCFDSRTFLSNNGFQFAKANHFWLYNYVPPGMFLCLELLLEYYIQLVIMDHLCHSFSEKGISAGQFQAFHWIVFVVFGVVD